MFFCLPGTKAMSVHDTVEQVVVFARQLVDLSVTTGASKERLSQCSIDKVGQCEPQI